MAEVSRSLDIPPHLRAQAAARARRVLSNSVVDGLVRAPDGKEVVANDLSSRQLRLVNEDAESATKTHEIKIVSESIASPAEPKTVSEEIESETKTHGVKISPTAITSSTAPTSREPSTYIRIADLKTRFGSLYQDTDDTKENHSRVRGNHSRRQTRCAKNNRESAWAHSKHIPKGNDGRWDTNWDCPDIYTPPTWKTNTNSACGDENPNYENDLPLNSWSGGWAPAPLNWDSRPAFRNGQSATLIEGWILESKKAFSSVFNRIVSTKDAETTACNIAPRYWVPNTFGKQPPQSFWNEMIKSKPLPIDESDLESARPWWETYNSPDSSLLQAYSVPIISRVDPDESLHEQLARENDNGSKSHAQNRIQLERAKRDAAETQRRKVSAKERRLREMLAEQQQDHAAIHLPLKPKTKMYIRSARLEDIQAICTIYNFYVTQTCSTSRTLPMDMIQMTDRFRNIQKNSLPFVVACERGKTMRATGRRNKRREDEDVVLPDVVIGFAHAECYSNINDAYRYSVSAEIYMVSSHYRKGVASCLMDKLLACLDPQYIERRGYNVTDEKLKCAEPEKAVQSIMISIPYDESSPLRMQWTRKWLIESFGFDNVGDFVSLGVKHGKKISVCTLQRNTGVVIDLDEPPDLLRGPD